jgi:hypothetical protein
MGELDVTYTLASGDLQWNAQTHARNFNVPGCRRDYACDEVAGTFLC